MDAATATIVISALILLVNGAGAVWNSNRYTKIEVRLARIETVLKMRGLNGALTEED